MKSDFRISGRSVNPIVGILVSVLFLVALFMLARFFFTVLYYLSPLMLIATLVIDYRVVLEYIQWLVGLVRRNALLGVGAILLSVLGFPVVSAYLLIRAVFRRRIRQMEKEFEEKQEGEYIDYEELNREALDLKRLEERQKAAAREKEKQQNRGDYDQYFE